MISLLLLTYFFLLYVYKHPDNINFTGTQNLLFLYFYRGLVVRQVSYLTTSLEVPVLIPGCAILTKYIYQPPD